MMAMAFSTASASTLSFFLVFVSLSSAAVTGKVGTIGVVYGQDADDLPEPSFVVSLLKREGVTAVRIYNTNHAILTAFQGSNISLIVGLTNSQLSRANNQSFTEAWVASNIVPYYPATSISAITVGNEVISGDSNSDSLISHLLPAMRNLRRSLQYHNLDGAIMISTPVSLGVLATSYPPSAGSFRSDLVAPVMKPLLEFLTETSSPFMVNLYPFFSYAANPGSISIEYALFNTPTVSVIDAGLKYLSLFDAQVDAIYSAMSSVLLGGGGPAAKNNGSKLPRVVVTETGWPHIDVDDLDHSVTDVSVSSDSGATADNSATYNRNLVKRVLEGGGTPLFPEKPLEVYIFSLFNENLKTRDVTLRNFGLFQTNGDKFYNISLSTATQPDDQPELQPNTAWCGELQQALDDIDDACGRGNVDDIDSCARSSHMILAFSVAISG